MEKKLKKIAIVHAIHDGVTSMYTGVGRITQNIKWSFPIIAKNLRKDYQLSLYFITPNYPRTCSVYNEDFRKSSQIITKRFNGKIYHLPIPKSCVTANQIWGDISRWKKNGRQAANIAEKLSAKYDLVILFHHDISFASSNLSIKNRDKIISIWVPHSSALIHHYNKLDQPRLNLEKSVAVCINTQKNTYAAAIGSFMRNHLHNNYEIKSEKIIDFKNGIIKNLYPNFTHKKIVSLLKRYDIPTQIPLVLFWGRCTPHKGLDIIIKAIEKIKIKNFHFVNICPIETSSYSYSKQIQQQSDKLGSMATTIYNFDNKLPFAILSHLKTKLVLIPSRSDPCPLTVMEAKLYSRKTPFVIIASKIDGLAEQYVPGGTLLTKLNKKYLAKTIKRALKLETKSRQAMAKMAYQDLKNWNFVKNHLLGLKILMKKIKE